MASEQPSDSDQHDRSSADNILAMEANQFQAAFGESVENPLDIDTWQLGDDLAAMYSALEQQITQAVEEGGRIRQRIPTQIFPYVFLPPQAPPRAGCYNVFSANPHDIHPRSPFN